MRQFYALDTENNRVYTFMSGHERRTWIKEKPTHRGMTPKEVGDYSRRKGYNSDCMGRKEIRRRSNKGLIPIEV